MDEGKWAWRQLLYYRLCECRAMASRRLPWTHGNAWEQKRNKTTREDKSMNSVQSQRPRARLRVVTFLVCGMMAASAVAMQAARAEEEAIRQANSLSRAFRSAAKKVLPTVVKIQTTTLPNKGGDRRLQGNPFKGTPFEEFFGDEEMPGFRFHGPMPRQSGVGSGVIIDPSGVIATNNHVVADADEVTVELSDGRKFKATDIKRDEDSDLAIVRIKVDGPLPAATLGDSDQLEIGDWVIAVGTPFELDQTVSAGIISAKGRTLGGNRAKYLQTDAAINPGNSGGPLVSLNGEVVGINTAIASRSGGYQGVGFAVTSNVVKWVTKQLIDSGSVQRAYLGVGIGQITSELAEQLGVHPGEGILVSEVLEKSPAAEAGFQVEDVILKFAGKAVGTPIQLQEAVERSPLGSTQEVEIRRDGKSMTLKVVVKPLPKDYGVASRGPKTPGRNGDSKGYSNEALGLEVADLTPEIAQQLGYKGTGGVVVTEVDPAGVAAGAGLAETAIILRVGRTPVTNTEQFKAAMEKQSLKDGIMLLVRLHGGNRFLVLKKP
jgi:serine protease Do